MAHDKCLKSYWHRVYMEHIEYLDEDENVLFTTDNTCEPIASFSLAIDKLLFLLGVVFLFIWAYLNLISLSSKFSLFNLLIFTCY